MKSTISPHACLAAIALLGASMAAAPAMAAGEQPAFEKVTEGLEKVVSTIDGAKPFYELYRDADEGKLLAVLPPNYENQLFMISCTVSGGDPEAGVMGPTHYVEWRKIKDQLALVTPNLAVRTDGDQQAKDSVGSLYTGRVIVTAPIVSMAPGKRPVIDIGSLCTADAGKFFGNSIFGQYGPSVNRLDPRLATLTKSKAFPENVIFEYEAPRPDGRLIRLTFNFSKLEGTPGYTPRKADPRVGYFYNWHQDFARTANMEVTDRYITRWNLEKADPSLTVSPPREPIVWYIEHTTPIKFRRYVREGIEMWNDAYEQIGIINAVEVYQQDAATGAHMEKDPEDARYNFFRWNASDQGYAIGPSRSNPLTGEILDADVVWHQGLTRAVRTMLENLSADLAEQTFSPETLAFFDEHPQWDPRVRLAPVERQAQITRQRQLAAGKAVTEALESHDHPWTNCLNDPTNSACRIGSMLSLDMSLANAAVMAGVLQIEDDAEMLDGLPEQFIGAMIRYISAHEVGHCLGLQHNMAASTIRTLEEINSPGFDGPSVGSVMDYCAANINHELGEVQGPYATLELGPYDRWAIAYGYGDEKDLKDVLAKVSEPDHIFVSQMAMGVGSDPRNMTWDLGANNLNFAESRLSLVHDLRQRLINDVVKEGESWKTARDRFQSLLGTHVQSLFIASTWVGGSYINNDHKGDPGDRAPIADVSAADQRRAMNLIIAHSFSDDAYGLTPELIRHLGREYWWDPAGRGGMTQDPSYNAHDMVGGVQATALSLLLNPTTLRRVYDNEYRTNHGSDSFTLAEVVRTVSDNVWSECEDPDDAGHSAEKPMISSFRRNLQREHVQRLIDLALLDNTSSPALRTISALATQELQRIDTLAGEALEAEPDPYTAAHLSDAQTRIAKAMDARYMLTP